HVSDMERLQFTDANMPSNLLSLTLGTHALQAGIEVVDVSALPEEVDIKINLSGFAGEIDLLLGAGSNTVIGSSSTNALLYLEPGFGAVTATLSPTSALDYSGQYADLLRAAAGGN